MATVNRDAATIALLVGGLVIALLFAGQVWSFATRFIGRAIAGAVQIALAAGIAYGVYQLYVGWQTADETTSSTTGQDLDTVTDEYVTGEFDEQDLEDELEDVLETEER